MPDRDRRCRYCGCTDSNACLTGTDGGPCAWVAPGVAVCDTPACLARLAQERDAEDVREQGPVTRAMVAEAERDRLRAIIDALRIARVASSTDEAYVIAVKEILELAPATGGATDGMAVLLEVVRAPGPVHFAVTPGPVRA